jgi:hypothetical protein
VWSPYLARPSFRPAITSMLARRLTTFLPAMTPGEAIETTRIHSVAGLTGARRTLVTTRPFRAPHHTISDAGVIGGGQRPLSGEVSLAHHGLLFLDERPACTRQVLEVWRLPLGGGGTSRPPRGGPRRRCAGRTSGAHKKRHQLVRRAGW